MTVSELLKERNIKILERYRQLKANKVPGPQAMKIIRNEFSGISVHTIEQVLYNKNYSNSPLKNKD